MAEALDEVPGVRVALEPKPYEPAPNNIYRTTAEGILAAQRIEARLQNPENRRIVVASYGGAPRNPAWFHNVADRGANPEVVVRDRDRVFWSIAEVLKGSERDELWAHLVADRPFYADYQTRTERTIPLVRLVELRPYEP